MCASPVLLSHTVCSFMVPEHNMDFSVKRLAADAGTFLSRAVQVTAHSNTLACFRGQLGAVRLAR